MKAADNIDHAITQAGPQKSPTINNPGKTMKTINSTNIRNTSISQVGEHNYKYISIRK
jgi:hypothetical protein